MSLADKIKPGPRSAAPAPRRASGNPSSRLERARRYVAKMPEAISGSGGHTATWNVARKCAADFELSADETFAVLCEFNTRCTPPWSEAELRHKAHDAVNKARVANPVEDRERHWTMPENHYTEPSAAPEHTDDDAPDAPPPYEQWGADGEPPPAQEEPTAEEPLRGLQHLGKVALVGREGILELASTPVEYVWTDIAVAGTIVLIAGPPAEGKTTLLFLILAARMNPGEVVTLLGRAIQPAPPGQWVVLIEGEHSEASTSRKLVKSLKLLGLDDAALSRVVIVARKAVRLGSPEWSDVVRMVRAALVSDIAIDTVARVAPADADNEREQVAVFDAVAQAIEAAPEGQPKPIVWAVAHTRKANNGELADVSGSAQRTGQADTVLLIKGEKVDGRTVSTKVTFAKLREDPDDYPMPVTFAIEKDADGVLRINNSDGKTVLDDRPLEVRIVEKLQAEPQTKSALRTSLGRNFEDLEAAITNLFSSHQIESVTIRKGTREFKGFALKKHPYPDRDPGFAGTSSGPHPYP